jgi:Putative amidase domain
MRAPSLINISQRTSHTPKRHRLSGRWVRHHGRIILLGVDDIDQAQMGSSWNSFEVHHPRTGTALSEDLQIDLAAHPMELQSEEDFEGSSADMPSYNAVAAVAYARKFWNRPCSDLRIAPDLKHCPELQNRGFIDATSVNAFLKRDREQAEDAVDAKGNVVTHGSWKYLDDCTHFIFCCIGCPPEAAYPKHDTEKAVIDWRAKTAAAGGLPLPNHSLDVSMYGLSGLCRLIEFLTAPARRWARILAADVSKDKAHPLMEKMMPGDLIAYSSGHKFDHLVMLLGEDGKRNGKIACHTYSRSDAKECTWDNKWDEIKPPGGDYHVTLLQMPRPKKPT